MNPALIQTFASGALMMGFMALWWFFVQFYRRTQDRLFLFFAIAFLLLAIERMVLVFSLEKETQFLVYTVRLAAFISLAYAIWDRNRRKP